MSVDLNELRLLRDRVRAATEKRDGIPEGQRGRHFAETAVEVAESNLAFKLLQHADELLAAADQSATLRAHLESMVLQVRLEEKCRPVTTDMSQLADEAEAALSASPVEKRAAGPVKLSVLDTETWPADGQEVLFSTHTSGLRFTATFLAPTPHYKQARFRAYKSPALYNDYPIEAVDRWAPLPDWSKS